MLDSEKFAGPREAGLNLIGDQEAAMPAAQLGSALKVILIREIDALALDRLNDEGRSFARSERLIKRREIVERHRDAVGHERSKAGAENIVAVY